MSERDSQLPLEAYLLDLLDPDERAEVEARLRASAPLRAELAAAREALAALGRSLPPVPPNPALRRRVLASAAATCRFAHLAPRAAALLDVGESRALSLLARVDAPDTRWDPGPAPGIALHHFDAGPAVARAITGFVRIAPGVSFPHHEHAGRERGLILQGAYRDGATGRVLRAGDAVDNPPGSEHDLTALAGPPLVFIVVVEGGVRIGEVFFGPDHPDM